MIQFTIAELKELFANRTLFPEGSQLKVSYKKTGNASKFNVDYRLIVGDLDLIVGGWQNITKVEANKNICTDILLPLISRGHFLLTHIVKQNAGKDSTS